MKEGNVCYTFITYSLVFELKSWQTYYHALKYMKEEGIAYYKMYTHFRFCIETVTLIVCTVCALTIAHEKTTKELLLE